MSKWKEAAERAAQSTLQKLLERERDGWPPDCLCWGYQPERPEPSREKQQAAPK